MPRLSIDLDLVFTNHHMPRAEARAAINEGLRTSRNRLAKRGFKVQAVSASDMGETKLLVRRDDIAVKIEVNTVIRGTIHPTRIVSTSEALASPESRCLGRCGPESGRDACRLASFFGF